MNNWELADELERLQAVVEDLAPASHGRTVARLTMQACIAAKLPAILAALRAEGEGWRPSEEQVERAAEALHADGDDAQICGEEWEDCGESIRERYRDQVRLVLRAASEPPQ